MLVLIGHEEKEFFRLSLAIIAEVEWVLCQDEVDPVLLSLGSLEDFGATELEAEPGPTDKRDSILDN